LKPLFLASLMTIAVAQQAAAIVSSPPNSVQIGAEPIYYYPAPADSQKQPASVEQMCDKLAKMRDYGWYKDKFENCMYFGDNILRAARANGPK
jgi:hypothetical protein